MNLKEYYNNIWEQLPAQLTVPDAKLREQILLRNVQKGDSVLDLGCGTGDFTALLQRYGCHPLGLEISSVAQSRAKAKYPQLHFDLIQADGCFPLPAASINVVWASEVIEHVLDTIGWLSEIRRVLRPGGRLVLTTPYHGRLRNLQLALQGFETHFHPVSDHIRFYTQKSLHNVLDSVGFNTIAINSQGGLPGFRKLLTAVVTLR